MTMILFGFVGRVLVSSEGVILLSHLLFSFLGANKPIYAPEPLDVGKILRADIVSDTQTISVTTVSAIDPGLYSLPPSLSRFPSYAQIQHTRLHTLK